MPSNITCNTCSMTACECILCVYCNIVCLAEDICLTCNKCINSCCECSFCSEEGCTFVGRSNYEYIENTVCGHCFKCSTHCKCFLCLICNIKHLPYTTDDYNNDWCNVCRTCNKYCTHYMCETCNIKGNKKAFCENCNECPLHCTCIICSNCNVSCRSRHSFHAGSNGCNLCINCCLCNSKGVPFRKGEFKFYTSMFSKGQFKLNKLRKHISVEIEVDKYDCGINSKKINVSLREWKDAVVYDGSIGSSGFEITTNPTNGDLFVSHLKEITDGLKEIKAYCSDSCGLHVHINCKGEPLLNKDGTQQFVLDTKTGKNTFLFDKNTAYNQYDLHRLILLYAKLEEALFKLCSNKRLTSRFSTVCGEHWLSKAKDSKNVRNNLLTTMYFNGKDKALSLSKKDINYKYGSYVGLGKTIKASKNHKYNSHRYKALNIHSYFLRGSIEFRHHEGTTDFNEIKNWSLICATVVSKASEMTEDQIKKLPSNSCEALLAILPSNLQVYCEEKWKVSNCSWERYNMIMKDIF